tara:strand:- start:149 stop:781 length:633 start_codon:yes stop_codon:yes gene_type:complete
MKNNDNLLRNYIESQKRQKEILEETKKRRDENNKQKEKIVDDDKKLSSKTDHEKTDYLKDLKDYLKDAVIKNPDDREKFQEIKKRVTYLDLASKCKNEIDKIYFIDNDWIGGGGTSDAEDETWREMMYSFLDQYDLNEDDYDFVFSEIESICFNKKRFCKDEDKVIIKFKKIFTDVEELIKKFKLYIFSFYFDDEPHSTYRGEIEWIKDL